MFMQMQINSKKSKVKVWNPVLIVLKIRIKPSNGIIGFASMYCQDIDLDCRKILAHNLNSYSLH